jgi:hypothetical protein
MIVHPSGCSIYPWQNSGITPAYTLQLEGLHLKHCMNILLEPLALLVLILF